MNSPSVVLGMVLSAIAFIFFTAFDTLAKYLTHSSSVFQIMSVSYTVGSILMVGYVLAKHKANSASVFKMQKPVLHLLRGFTQIIGQTCAYLALPHVSLAEFYVLIFTMPVIVIIVSSLTLKEHIKPFVWAALALNFVGVLIALRPDQSFNMWMLVLFAGTFVLACSLVLLRKMMQTESSEMTSITTTASLAVGAIIPALLVPSAMDVGMIGWMVLGGVFCCFAQLMLSSAYKLAPAAYASPPQFLQLIYGAVAGYLVFGEVPTMWIFIGGAIVIIANLFLILRPRFEQANQNS